MGTEIGQNKKELGRMLSKREKSKKKKNKRVYEEKELDSEPSPKRQAVAEASLPLDITPQNDEERQVFAALNAYWKVGQEQIEKIEELPIPRRFSFTKNSLVPDKWSVSVSFVRGDDIQLPGLEFFFVLGAMKIIAYTLKDLEPVLRSLQGECRAAVLKQLKEEVEIWASEIGRAYEVINDWLATCKALSLETLADICVGHLTKIFTVTAPSLLPWSFDSNVITFCWNFEDLSRLPEFLECVIPFLKALCQKYKKSISFVDPK